MSVPGCPLSLVWGLFLSCHSELGMYLPLSPHLRPSGRPAVLVPSCSTSWTKPPFLPEQQPPAPASYSYDDDPALPDSGPARPGMRLSTAGLEALHWTPEPDGEAEDR